MPPGALQAGIVQVPQGREVFAGLTIEENLRDGVIAITVPARDLVDNPDVVKSYLGG